MMGVERKERVEKGEGGGEEGGGGWLSTCAGVSFLVSVSERLALAFFHESKRSRWPRRATMLLAATAATAGSSSDLKLKSACITSREKANT